MDTSVQEALKIGLVNDQIHSIVISGGLVSVKVLWFVSASTHGIFPIVLYRFI